MIITNLHRRSKRWPADVFYRAAAAANFEGFNWVRRKFNFALQPLYLKKQYCDSIARNKVEMSETAALKSQLTETLNHLKTMENNFL